MIFKYHQKPQRPWKKFFAFTPVPKEGRFPVKDGQEMVWLQFTYRRWLDFREGSASYGYSFDPFSEEFIKGSSVPPKPRPRSGMSLTESLKPQVPYKADRSHDS